jgi:hypothetical protein
MGLDVSEMHWEPHTAIVPMPTLENIASTKTLATLEVLNVKMGEIALSLWTPPEDQLSNVIVLSDTQLHFVKLL